MLSINYSEKILGLQDVIIKKVESDEENLRIFVELKRRIVKCPRCGAETSTIHDYRTQKIKDISAFGKNVTIILRKRRYSCFCGKHFAEPNYFLPTYYRMTNRLVDDVINKLREERSYTSVAREMNLSVSTVIRIFDYIKYPVPKIMPEVIGIDEFKGNANGEKYLGILTDLKNGRVIDILPKRYMYYLTGYFKDKDRSATKYFISDMWRTYADISNVFFKNSTYVVDKYHWIRQVSWAFENVRKEEQKRFSRTHRIYFKHSRKLLLKRFETLTDEEKQQVNIMLFASANLSSAYFLKDEFLKILSYNDPEKSRIELKKWIDNALDCDIIHFVKCAKTLNTWLTGILNSFTCSYTNGFTEGCNNKIKVLKRNAYGYRNAERFRNRILHIFSNQIAKVA